MTKLTRTLYSWSTAAGTRAIQQSRWHLQCTIRSARDWREEKAANLQRTNTRCSSSSHWLTVKLRTKLISMTAAGNFIPQKWKEREKKLGFGWSLITGWYCAIVRVINCENICLCVCRISGGARGRMGSFA